MRGDRVEIVVDVGDGARTYEVVATRAGRRVEISTSRTVVEIAEVTRTGNPVRTARFMANRVLALIEHPAAEGLVGDTETADEAVRRTARLQALEERARPEPDW